MKNETFIKHDFPPLSAPRAIPCYTTNCQKYSKKIVKNCMHTCIYIWLALEESLAEPYDQFWLFLSELNDKFLLGFKWSGKEWINIKLDLKYVANYY